MIQEETNKTPILGEIVLTSYQMIKLVENTTATYKLNCTLSQLVDMFISEGKKERVRGDIAFCQSLHETGFFRYGGQVLPEQNNYAGIGALNNSPIGKGAWFTEPVLGVRAQIQHLKGYASKEPLNNKCVDPRYQILVDSDLLGIAANWEDLNGRWAVPGTNYGQRILELYNKALQLPQKSPSIIEEEEILHLEEEPIQPTIEESTELKKESLLDLIKQFFKYIRKYLD